LLAIAAELLSDIFAKADLTKDERTLLGLLHGIDGVSYTEAEVAQRLDKTIEEVRQSKNAAFRKLKKATKAPE
jgi:DNA-directed RNA polymerase sigma subunit (sigma70/sigma32)